MKNNRNVLKAVAAALLVLTAGQVAALGSQDVKVTAKVKDVCVLNFEQDSEITVALGTMDPSDTSVTEVTKDFSVFYRCTKGAAAPTISTTSMLTMTDGGDGSIAFTLDAFATDPGAGFSANATATSTVRVPYNNYRDQPAGDYSKSITLEITP